jgi:thiol:disulfide interchange protein DsbD
VAEASEWFKWVLGPLAFSLTFAAPFFILALFPSLLKTLPKSGSWMNSVKVVMGFLELAAAFKFIRAAELALLKRSELFTFDLCMGIYVAICVACGLYLLGVYRLPHDHGAPETISVLRLMWSLAFLALGCYLLPAMFKSGDGEPQKPRGQVGEWIESFLLPEPVVPGATARAGKGPQKPVWTPDLDKALAQAEKEGKPLFIDFTGLT